MEIKEAAVKHIPAMLKLWMEATYFNNVADPVELEGMNALDLVTANFKNKIASADDLVLVVIEGDKVVGYSFSTIQLSTDLPLRRIGKIYDMFITSACRGKGIGPALREKTYAWFESKKITEITPGEITGKTISADFWKKNEPERSGLTP